MRQLLGGLGLGLRCCRELGAGVVVHVHAMNHLIWPWNRKGTGLMRKLRHTVGLTPSPSAVGNLAGGRPSQGHRALLLFQVSFLGLMVEVEDCRGPL